MAQITPDQLLSFLSNHLHSEITSIEPTRQGEWSQTFSFCAGQQRKVIRFSAYDEDFKKDRFAARYSSPNLPIPQIEEIGEAFGRSFAISPYVDGEMIDNLPAERMHNAIPALMELLNALRAVDGSQTKGYGGFDANGNGAAPSWQAYLATMTPGAPSSRLSGWEASLAQNKGAQELYKAGRRRLLELIPFCPEERHLVHNDLLHFNLIIQEDRVAAVIDWGCALWGDFLYDLAMFAAWQFYYPAMAQIDIAQEALQFFEARHIALPHFAERLACYQIHLLLDSLAYNSWQQGQENLELTMHRLEKILCKDSCRTG
jgi:hygromycin-B 4-O-kinase